MDLNTPVKDAGRVFKMYAPRLEKLGITTLGDFLYHVPHRYNDFSLVSKIAQAQPGEAVTIHGIVDEIKNSYIKRGKTLQKAKVSDDSGTIEVTWFNQPYLARTIQQGDTIALSGKVGTFFKKITMESPEYELLTQNNPEQLKTIHTGRLVPIYPETRGVSSKWLRRQIYKIIQEGRQNIFEYLPDSILERFDLSGLLYSLEQIHFPQTLEIALKARTRLAFDELLQMQLAAFLRRQEWNKKKLGNRLTIEDKTDKLEEFISSLPFELTNAQKNAFQEISSDLQSEKPMNRLLEGDVGSGKTVVSAIAMYIAYLNGLQSVIMAPTEILANQHHATISKLLTPFGVKVGLRTGSSKGKGESVKGEDILVGTHAVLNVDFEKLGLVVIDEQQRFGVEQRGIIREKGRNPHVLTMTATPIPRTIALTLYGDLDLSVLDELPKGRMLIKTWLVPEEKRENGYNWIEEQIKTHNTQAFIVCPFIEESENMTTVKAAKKEFEYLQKEVFPNLRLGLLHGKLKSKEKDLVLKDFRNKKYDILVATPVVEVGIDIPNATIIVIEAAERFGLAQLHQLRGRVGRGSQQSYCLLFTDSDSPQTRERLKAMETSHIGAELAELDLKIRGSGDLYGTMQHGRTRLKVANFSDFELIQKAKTAAKELLPKLSEYPVLKEKLALIVSKQISPD